MIRKYVLQRTGRPPLAFTGHLLGGASGLSEEPPHDRPEGKWTPHHRWHELKVYETTGGQFVLEVAYRSMWSREDPWLDAEPFSDLRSLAAFLEGYSPTSHVKLIPEGVHGAEAKNATIMADVERRWASLVTTLLASLPESATEVA